MTSRQAAQNGAKAKLIASTIYHREKRGFIPDYHFYCKIRDKPAHPMKKKIKLVIFDLDGTLVNAYAAVYQSVNYAMRAAGFPPIDHQTIKRTVGWGDRHLIERFVGEEHSTKTLAVYRRHHAEALKHKTKLLPGAKRILASLKKEKYKLAVASNRPTRFSRIIVRQLEIKKYFDYILCGDKVARPKPYPDILLKILNRLSLKPQEAIYVGDMTIDVQTGKRANIKTVAVTTGSHSAAELSQVKPYRIVEKILKIRDIVAELNGTGG